MNCWWRQWMISRLGDDGRAVPEAIRRHAATCSACSEHLRVATLLRSSVPARGAVPAGFHQQLLTSLRYERAAAPRQPHRPIAGLPLWSIASAVVVLAAGLLMYRPGGEGGGGGSAPAARPALPGMTVMDLETHGGALVLATLEEERRRITDDVLATSQGLLAALEISPGR
jgi:hypothetical protein